MVQKKPSRRGRPREYDSRKALERAMRAFWQRGFSATSLDDLSAATGMKRPSLYLAFGDKRKIYLSLLDTYIAASNEAVRRELAPERPLRQALTGLYRGVLSAYLVTGDVAYGCFLMGTAVTEAPGDAEVRAKLAAFLAGTQRGLEARLSQAQEQGELPAEADVPGLASVAAAVLHSLGVRARVGDSHASLMKTVHAVVQLICGSKSAVPKRKNKASR